MDILIETLIIYKIYYIIYHYNTYTYNVKAMWNAWIGNANDKACVVNPNGMNGHKKS